MKTILRIKIGHGNDRAKSCKLYVKRSNCATASRRAEIKPKSMEKGVLPPSPSALFQLKYRIVLPAQAGIQRFDKFNLLHRIYLNAMQRINVIVRPDPHLRGNGKMMPTKFRRTALHDGSGKMHLSNRLFSTIIRELRMLSPLGIFRQDADMPQMRKAMIDADHLGDIIMKSLSIRWIAGSLILAFTAFSVTPVTAQPGRGPRPSFGRPVPPPPPHHHHHRGPSDFDKALGVIGAVGAVAAIANGYTPYGYYRHSRPVVVVPQQPSTVIVERPVVVEKEVIVEKPVYATPSLPNDYYSPKLGATFKIQNMQIPGYKFTAARLTSDPLEGSPLADIGLVKGDVITRLDDDTVNRLEVLERHEKATLVRYIKTGTTKVKLGRIYIPTDEDLTPVESETYYAP